MLFYQSTEESLLLLGILVEGYFQSFGFYP